MLIEIIEGQQVPLQANAKLHPENEMTFSEHLPHTVVPDGSFTLQVFDSTQHPRPSSALLFVSPIGHRRYNWLNVGYNIKT